MDNVTLAVNARTKDASVKEMRLGNLVPGVIYGNSDNTLISVDEVELKRVYIKAGESTLVELDLGDKKLPVLFHALQFDPVSDRMIHVDFYAVNMKKEVEAEVHIRHEGESPAAKDFGATLIYPTETVTVRAMPAKLPHDLELDITKLAEIDATLTVADLKVPEGVTILTDSETVLVIAQEQRAEEVAEEPVAAEETEEATTPAEGEAPEAGEKKE